MQLPKLCAEPANCTPVSANVEQHIVPILVFVAFNPHNKMPSMHQADFLPRLWTGMLIIELWILNE